MLPSISQWFIDENQTLWGVQRRSHAAVPSPTLRPSTGPQGPSFRPGTQHITFYILIVAFSEEDFGLFALFTLLTHFTLALSLYLFLATLPPLTPYPV
jgi:hypothetical protein